MADEINISSQGAPDSASSKILEALARLQSDASGYRAILFNVSKLMPCHRGSDQIDQLFAEAHRIFATIKGKVFKLKNDDLVCLIRNEAIISSERCISQFKRGLSNDPLMANNNKKDLFCTIYELGLSWKSFYNYVYEIETDPLYADIKARYEGASADLLDRGINSETLSSIEKILSNSTLLPYIKRQPIYWYDGIELPRKISSHIFLSIQTLQNALALSDSLMANAWLFKYITILLDKQLISLLPELLAQKNLENIHMSLNINLRSIITANFHRFLRSYNKQTSISFCIDIIDYIAHPEALIYAKELLSEKGFRLILNGINASHLDIVNLTAIPVHTYKINWSPGIHDKEATLKALIEKMGPYCCILHKCDTEKEVDQGLAWGIRQFQGFGIDQVSKKQNK